MIVRLSCENPRVSARAVLLGLLTSRGFVSPWQPASQDASPAAKLSAPGLCRSFDVLFAGVVRRGELHLGQLLLQPSDKIPSNLSFVTVGDQQWLRVSGLRRGWMTCAAASPRVCGERPVCIPHPSPVRWVLGLWLAGFRITPEAPEAMNSGLLPALGKAGMPVSTRG